MTEKDTEDFTTKVHAGKQPGETLAQL